MLGPVVLDGTVNGRPLRRPGMPDSNRSQSPARAPHGIYRCADAAPSRGDPDDVALPTSPEVISRRESVSGMAPSQPR